MRTNAVVPDHVQKKKKQSTGAVEHSPPRETS